VSRWWVTLIRYARPHWLRLSAMVVVMLLGVALNLLKPWPMKLIVDNVLVERRLPVIANWMTYLPGGASRPIPGESSPGPYQ
jgi:ABC-type multidrug transport system fused ATPase/permease subunit